MKRLMITICAAVVATMVTEAATEFTIPGFKETFEFSLTEKRHMETKTEEKNLVRIDFTADKEWCAARNDNGCVKHTEEERPFVRMGGDKMYGFTYGVTVPKPIAVTEGETLEIDLVLRNFADSTYMIYLYPFDKHGNPMKSAGGSSFGWEFSTASYAFVKYALKFEKVGKWVKAKHKFTVPNDVAALKPIIAPWRGTGFDCGGIRVRSTGIGYVMREIEFGRAVSRDENKAIYRNEKETLEVAIVSRKMNDGLTAIGMMVTELAKEPQKRALDIKLEWKRNLKGWCWHKNWRQDEVIDEKQLGFAEIVGGFPVSRYPFTAVSNSKSGEHYFFGTPFTEKAYESRVIMSKGIVSSIPLGIWVRGELGRTATYKWLFGKFEGDWGFRSAAKEYYKTQAKHMPAVGIGNKEGAWIWPINPAWGPQKPEDYGHYFWEAPSEWGEYNLHYIDEAHQKGIGVFPYIEPWGMRAYLAPKDAKEFPTVEQSYAEVQSWAAEKDTNKKFFGLPRNYSATALLNSMPLQPDGSLAYADDLYDNWSRWWRTVPDHRLKTPNRFSIVWDGVLKAALDKMDGVYIDSVAYGFSVNYRNVREEHLAVFDRPLIYDLETLKPCADGMQYLYLYLERLSQLLHPKGKRVWGNAFGIAHRFCVDIDDVFGGECGSWGNNSDDDHLARTSSDAGACEQRFFAYHRPISNLLQESHWLKMAKEVTAKGMEYYIDQQMFYGFYPAVSTIGGDEKVGYAGWRRYFDKNKVYERDRELFKRTIPVIRRLNKAGWEPETGLKASAEDVQVERFGTVGKGELLFTVHNNRPQPITTELTAVNVEGVEFKELAAVYKGQALEAVSKGWQLSLQPWETAVLLAK